MAREGAMVMKAWSCLCGISHCLVGHEGPPIAELEREVLALHHGDGHFLRKMDPQDVAPVPVS